LRNGKKYSPPLGGVRGDFMYYFSYNKNLKQFSRNLRKNQTDAEKLLWSRVRRKQIKDYQFFRQKPIGSYIADLYCKDAKLVIEIDGGQHYENQNIMADRKRNEYFQKLGLRVMRFTNLDILKNIENVVNKIYEEIDK